MPGDKYNEKKSRYWMDHADILYFLFFSRSDQGMTHELDHALDHVRAASVRSIVALNLRAKPPVSSLITGALRRYGKQITVVPFRTRTELRAGTVGAVANICETIYYDVRNRPFGEWEQSRRDGVS